MVHKKIGARSNAFLYIAAIIIVGGCAIIATRHFGNKKGASETKIDIDTQQDSKLWETPDIINYQDMSPSVLEVMKQNNVLYDSYSCFNVSFNADFKSSITPGSVLDKGLKMIEDHIYTFPLHDENGNELPPNKSKYKIEYSSICKLEFGDDEAAQYAAVFLTTQSINANVPSFVGMAKAGGGWLGDSHFALISAKETKIYERFPFTADLIRLPEYTNGKEKIMRYGEYYSCGKIIMIGNKNIIIRCSGNTYSFDRTTEKFTEIAVCGPELDAMGSMTNKLSCYDGSAKQYFTR